MSAQRIRIDSAGSYDKLRLETFEPGSPAGDQVLIDVDAIGVNFADCIVRMGLYSSAKEYVGWPITPGFEVAGRIKAVGPEVSDLAPEDEVLAVTRFDGYATSLVVPRHQVFRRPAMLSVEEAAGFPAVFLTAWYALSELARPRPGQDVLIHSAAGGVGGALVQLTGVYGGRSVGVVGASHKVEVAQSFGCDHVIDKSTEDLWARASSLTPAGYHLVFDANGVETLKQSYKHLGSPGKLVIYGFHTMFERGGSGRPPWPKLVLGWLRTPRFNPLDMTDKNRSVLAFNLSYLFDATDILEEGMKELLDLIERGEISAPPVTTWPFEDVADAHRAIESGQTVGKLVLTVDR